MKIVTFLGNDYVIESGVGLPTGAFDLQDLSGPQLVSLYNLLVSNLDGGNGVTKFTNKDIGIKRTIAKLVEFDNFDPDDDVEIDDEPAAPQPDVLKATAKAEGKSKIKVRKVREGSNKSRMILLLRSDDGASLNELSATFGLQNHTVRSMISRDLKKHLGLNIIKSKVDGRGNVYRIAA